MAENDFAIEYICARRMHLSFTIPASETHKRLKITYAIAGLENDDAPTIVFLSGMYGMRWTALMQHHIALKIGVRFVCVDRPSFGGTTPVELSERISTWLYLLPHLMAHLKCTHIVPVAASAGTTYLLNTLYHYPNILPPKDPYSAILAPWVHPKHSNNSMLSFVASSWMPKFLVEKQWDNICGFFATKLLPRFAASGGLMESVSASGAIISKSAYNHISSQTQKQKDSEDVDDDEAKSLEVFGMTLAQKKAVHKLWMKYMFAEDTSGANDEALLCLKKGTDADVDWGICEDYEGFVPKLAEEWKHFSGDENDGRKRLRLEVYYSTVDVMIGEGGQKYFEECWRKENCGNEIDFNGSITQDTTHDEIGSPEKGVLEKVFREAKKALS